MSWPIEGAVWFAGCGNMGSAILSRWLECGLNPARVTVIDPAPASLPGVRWVAAPPQGEAAPALFVLGIKPQMLDDALPAYAGAVSEQTILLSMLAGVELGQLRKRFPQAGAIVRAMPNLAARLGKGVTGLMMDGGHDAAHAAVDAAMHQLGLAEWLTEEDQFHALTAVSGSGPAFLYRFVAALAKSGTALGLPEDQAMRLAKGMAEGAAALVAQSPDHPDDLAARVTSKGGTTAEGLAVLDHDSAMDALIAATLEATARRSRELADAAKG
ncbi:MAG: pyrroline-5-carboxylate reductase [Sphingomonadales bacterium]|nr:pyrroline-5-carboxylate reductase [Sphingomonadales bacterium]